MHELPSRLPSRSDAEDIAHELLGETVTRCTRFTTGLRHWVYDVVLESGRAVVLRLSHPDHHEELRGGIYWSDLLRNQGVRVPEVLGQDLTAPQPYVALERLPGTDLGNVFVQLSRSQLRGIAATVTDMQQRTSRLPVADGFGYALNYRSPLESSWHAVIEASIARSDRQIRAVGAVHPQWAEKVQHDLEQAGSLLDAVQPVAFLHDATTKNVIVNDASVSGLVDVDQMAFGDPLWTVALTQMSLLSAHRPIDYVEFLTAATVDELARERLRLYTATFCLGFLAELGQQFNQSSATAIDPIHMTHLERLLKTLLRRPAA